ncbi:MAG: VWA domain-containing protein [Armatimonadetes bacterium]|nr:VWA domain-containing protein [Armatimonadota bacterium]
MSLLNPLSLLWLLFAVPAILFLYLLKMKRRDRVVSSVLLWSRVIKDVQANTPFQKLRRNLLLFLQILLVLLIAVALSRPFVRVRAPGGKNVALVIDGSASMRATDVPGGRFEEARRQARRMVDGMGRGDQAMVILATARAHPLCPLTGDTDALRRALDAMRPGDTTTNLGDAVALAASLLWKRPDAEIFILSDGAFEEMSLADRFAPAAGADADSGPRAARLHYVKIGRRGENVGITALDVRKSLAGAFDYQAFARVRNFGTADRRFALELYRDDSLINAREVSLAPGQAHGEVFGIQGSAVGALRVRLDAADDLAADNAAAVMLEPRRRLNVLLATPGNLFLENALNVDPRVSLAKAAPGAVRASDVPRYDIIVLDGKAPSGLPAKGRYLFLGTGGEAAPVEITGQVDQPSFLDWDRRHPVTRFLDLSRVQIARALVARPRPWGQALADSEAGPLLVAGEREGLRSLFLGFDLTQSDLPVRVAFPILLANAIDWLMGSGADAASVRWRTGDVLTAEIPADVSRVEVTLPDGARRAEAVRQSPFLFAETDQAGLYRLEGRRKEGTFTSRIAVNLLSEEESDIRPRDRIRIGHAAVASADPGSQRVPREIWRWVSLAALCLLAFEWYAYHRRL